MTKKVNHPATRENFRALLDSLSGVPNSQISQVFK